MKRGREGGDRTQRPSDKNYGEKGSCPEAGRRRDRGRGEGAVSYEAGDGSQGILCVLARIELRRTSRHVRQTTSSSPSVVGRMQRWLPVGSDD